MSSLAASMAPGKRRESVSAADAAAAAAADNKFESVKGDWWLLPLSDAVSQVLLLLLLLLLPYRIVTQGLFDQSSHVCMYIEHCHDCRFRVTCYVLRVTCYVFRVICDV